MNWDELYAQGIDVEDISRDSEEYQTMFSAAVHGNPTAQYCLGLWAEKVHKKPDVALTWLKKAAQQNFEEAIEALQRLVGEQGAVSEGVATEDVSPTVQTTSLVIKEHSFQAAKNSLKKREKSCLNE